VEEEWARIVNDVLSDVTARSGLFVSSLPLTIFDGYQVALKTGTTNDYVDAWTVGYTPQVVVGVWAGNNRREPMQQQGSSILAALPIWSRFFGEVLKEYPAETFTRPAGQTAEKPILRGEWNSQNHIHSILYYLDKNDPSGLAPKNPNEDPQFNNWETAVINWAKENVPNFSDFNKGSFSYNSFSGEAVIEIISPRDGEFIKGREAAVEVEIKTESEIESIKLTVNGRVIDEKRGKMGSNYKYKTAVPEAQLDLQNRIEGEIKTEGGGIYKKEVIVFK